VRGGHALVRQNVEFRIQAPDNITDEIDAKIVRQVGGRSNLREWDMPRDLDGDSFQETLVLSPVDAAQIVREEQPAIYSLIAARIGDWSLLPSREPTKQVPETSDKSQGGTVPSELAQPPLAVIGPPDSETPESVEEVTDIANVPNATSAKGDGVSHHEQEVPLYPDGIKFCVGETVDGFKKEQLFFNPSNTDLNQLNIGVVGDLGTGKTQLLKTLIYQTVSSSVQNRGIRPRFLILDYKKDYCSPDFVEAVGAKVIKPQHLPVNVFDRTHSKDALTPWLDRFNFFSDVLDKIYSGIGPVQRRQLGLTPEKWTIEN
jgi:DNA phosphorothioation-dependent restriction protein DptH